MGPAVETRKGKRHAGPRPPAFQGHLAYCAREDHTERLAERGTETTFIQREERFVHEEPDLQPCCRQQRWRTEGLQTAIAQHHTVHPQPECQMAGAAQQGQHGQMAGDNGLERRDINAGNPIGPKERGAETESCRHARDDGGKHVRNRGMRECATSENTQQRLYGTGVQGIHQRV